MFTHLLLTGRLLWQVAPTVPQVVWHSLIHPSMPRVTRPTKGELAQAW